jgi:hypothetical protein
MDRTTENATDAGAVRRSDELLFDLEPQRAPSPIFGEASREIHEKLASLPRVRLHYRDSTKGKRTLYYGWDGRPWFGERLLGKHHAEALRKYHEWEVRRSEKMAEQMLGKTERHANQLRAIAKEAVDIMRQILCATEARPKPGVYFLLGAHSELLYIGKSDNVLSRMSGHDEKEFEFVKMIHVQNSRERTKLEGRLIHLLRPPLNIAMSGGGETRKLIETEACYKIPTRDPRGRKKKPAAPPVVLYA